MAESAELNIVHQGVIREFVPYDPERALSAGKLVVRANNSSRGLSNLDRLFDVLQADALMIEPPIEVSRKDVQVVQFGESALLHGRSYGLELNLSLFLHNILTCTSLFLFA